MYITLSKYGAGSLKIIDLDRIKETLALCPYNSPEGITLNNINMG
jgi:hypothetical protein